MHNENSSGHVQYEQMDLIQELFDAKVCRQLMHGIINGAEAHAYAYRFAHTCPNKCCLSLKTFLCNLLL